MFFVCSLLFVCSDLDGEVLIQLNFYIKSKQVYNVRMCVDEYALQATVLNYCFVSLNERSDI